MADLEIFDDRIALGLIVERVLFVTFDGVLGHVEEIADAGGLAALEQRRCRRPRPGTSA